MQPINAFDLDAAIIFADILPPFEGMGLELDFVKVKAPPSTTHPLGRDVEKLPASAPSERSLWLYAGSHQAGTAELDTRGIPLIGFSGAPFTLGGLCHRRRQQPKLSSSEGLMMSDPPPGIN